MGYRNFPRRGHASVRDFIRGRGGYSLKCVMTDTRPRNPSSPQAGAPRLATRWKVSPPRELLWRSWDDEFVVFDPLSGDTHVLNPVAAEALQVLESQAIDRDGLANHMAQAMGMETTDTLRRHMQQLLRKFVDLGLIEPQPS